MENIKGYVANQRLNFAMLKELHQGDWFCQINRFHQSGEFHQYDEPKHNTKYY